VIALRSGDAPAGPAPVAWHQLHTSDVDGASATYREFFGWAQRELIDVPDPVGGHRLFAFTVGGPVVGSVANTGRREGVHRHWLFHFPVADVPAAVDRVRALGGFARDPVQLPDGSVIAACDDPRGAAFGLVRRHP
jgi:hypothetical protein